MVVGLILVRTHLGGNGLVPLLGVAEERVDIEHHAPERIDAVSHDLTDGIFRAPNFTHSSHPLSHDPPELWRSAAILLNACSVSQILLQITTRTMRPWPGPWRPPGARGRPLPWLASRLHRPASYRRSSPRRCRPAWRRGFFLQTRLRPDRARRPASQSRPGSGATTMRRHSPSGTNFEIPPPRPPGREKRQTDHRTA